MDFSDKFHSIFPLAPLFYPPELPLSSSLPRFNPLSPPLTLLFSPSLLSHLPTSTLPSLHFHNLRNFLVTDHPCPVSSTSALDPTPPSPPTNVLVSLASHLPNTLHLFFPTGENSHAIAFLSLTSQSDSPDQFQLTLDRTGDVFKQTEGFKHPHHRISSLSVSPCSGKSVLGNRVFEGLLLATTLYSVNWFRVETGSIQLDDEEEQRPFLVPLASHVFEKPVVHACFSPHLYEECAVLLENGELYLFNLCSKKSGRIVVRCHRNPGQFISCEYGAEPWTIIVACANVIVSVDLRNPVEEHTRILFQAKKLGSYDVYHMENEKVNHMEDKKEKFLFFCKSSYSNYHFSVLTKYQLMLLDVRRPLHPILRWEHGLDGPNYVAMLKLEELNPSIQQKPVPGSGFSIFAGSLSTGEFKLFHYGSLHKQEASCDPSLVALGVPSGISLSGQCSGTCNQLMDEHFYGKNTFVKDISWLRKQEKVVGFLVIPWNNSLIKPDSSGFTFIRLMSFGRLEVQNYGSSDDTQDNKVCLKEGMSVSCDILTACPDCKRELGPSRRYVFDLRYFYAYMDGDLSKILPMDNRQSQEAPLSKDLLALMHDSTNYTPSLSPFIDNATVPSSIVEIAHNSALNGLKPDLIPLAFAKYSDIFANTQDSNFQLLEVSNSFTSGEQRPLIVTKPYRRGQRWSRKSKAPRDKIVGPVLPVPVLLTLQEREKNGNCCVFQGDGTIVNQKCAEVHESIFTANLSADTEETSEAKHFFVYEPQCDIIRSKKLKRRRKTDWRDENYETFVCGFNTRSSCDQVKPDPDMPGPELFNVGPLRINFDLMKMEVGKVDNEEVQKLKGQISKWMNELKPYQDFCSSSKIPKFN